MRLAFEHLFAEYPVTVDRYCSDERDDRQSVMMMSCAAWAIESGAEVEVHWEPAAGTQRTGVRAVFLVLFSVAGYALKEAVDRYRAREDCQVIVCGPHAISFPDHCFRAGADAVVELCNRDLFLSILEDLRAGTLKRRYHTDEPVKAFPQQRTFRELGLIPPQPFANVVASTGCPYTCAFCTDATTEYAPQTADAVLQNISSCDERLIIFNDPLFGLGRTGSSILEKLARQRAHYFMAFTTSSLLKASGFRKQLFDAGFLMVEVGLENIHSSFAKNLKVDFIDSFSKCDFLVLVNYIYGLNPRDFDDQTSSFLRELSLRCPNVLPMVFVPFSLPETPLHAEHLKHQGIFDPSYLCIGNEILSMRLEGVGSPAEYYTKLDALNERLYDGHAERLRNWVLQNPRLDEERRQMMLRLVDRHEREAERATGWSRLLAESAPDTYRSFAVDALARAVPNFERYELCLEPSMSSPRASWARDAS
jgi:radical SAM superfamily enzyme YgiQ (UPF0313 family)